MKSPFQQNLRQSGTSIYWGAFVALICYMLLVFHPLVGHFDLFATHHISRLQTLQSVSLIQTESPSPDTDCPICSHLGGTSQAQQFNPPLALFLFFHVQSLPLTADQIANGLTAWIATRAPPVF